MDQRAGSLSGGERQMVAMGRALMMEPSVLLLDEPSAGLSPVLQDEVFVQTRRINRAGVSVVMVEQNAARCLQICDRAYVLDQGRNAYTGYRPGARQGPQGDRALSRHPRQELATLPAGSAPACCLQPSGCRLPRALGPDPHSCVCADTPAPLRVCASMPRATSARWPAAADQGRRAAQTEGPTISRWSGPRCSCYLELIYLR